jgi:hypothetical protein
MTPEQAEEIFYKTYREEQAKQQMEWSKPIIQKEVRMRAYEALIEAVKEECVREQAVKYLEGVSK